MGIPLPWVWDPNCEVLEACEPLLAKGENSGGFTPDDCYHGKKEMNEETAVSCVVHIPSDQQIQQIRQISQIALPRWKHDFQEPTFCLSV